MTGRLVAYAGPSVPVAERVARPDVGWRPPAARGDLDAGGHQAGDVVALIDGVLVSGHAPSPTECARLLAAGVTLWGSSSLGALRAVELRPLGMRGYGWVHDRVADRTVTWEDELVAVLDPRTYEARTLFLVNVRHGTRAAVAAGLLDAGTAGRYLDSLRRLHFSARTDAAVRAVAIEHGVPPAALAEILRPGHDIKRADALGLLAALGAVPC